MSSLKGLADSLEDVIRPFGDVDVLLFYGIVAPYLKGFLHGKELATIIRLTKGRIQRIIRRGSYNPPLYIDTLANAVTPELIDLRHRSRDTRDARPRISDDQALAWDYFPPRRPVEFLYSLNGEGAGRDIERIFFDIDRGAGMSAEDALEVTVSLVQAIMENDLIKVLIKGELFVSWTGKSFHVLLFLKEPHPARFYTEYLEYSGSDRKETLTEKFVSKIKNDVKINVTGGHVRKKNTIIIDPSQTPSGKLCRVPLGSLHIDDEARIDGVSVPLTPDMLDKDIISELEAYTPRKVLDELPELAARLPA